MQFQAIVRARIPRAECSQCGVKAIAIPWAGKHSRFTVLFEALAVEVLTACANIKRAAALLGLKSQAAHTIMERAVERGLARRSVDEVHYVGLDERSFGSGHSGVTVLINLDEHPVLDVAEERTQAAADTLWQGLPAEQRAKVRAVSTDMWQPFVTRTREHAPRPRSCTTSFV